MIIVTAKYRTKPGMRDKVLELAKPCVAGSRAENGNHDYTLYASTEHPDGILCFEKWESKEHLGAHGKTDHYKAFGEARKDLIDPDSFELNVYEIKE